MYKDWLKTNIKSIINNKSKEFAVHFELYPFKKMSFQDATTFTINELAKRHSELYVGLSGGYDSTYVVDQMKKLNVPFTPVIVNNEWQELELNYAFYWCHHNKVKPMVIDADRKSFVLQYLKIFKEWGNCKGPGSIPILYAAQKLKKPIITGNNLISDGALHPKEISLYMHEFYADLFDDIHIEPFFLDNLSIVESYLSSITDKDERADYLKINLYSLPYRPKMRWRDNFSLQIAPIRVGEENFQINFEEFTNLLRKYVK